VAKKPNKLLVLDSIEEIQAKNNQQATEKILEQIKARAERAQKAIEEPRKTSQKHPDPKAEA
jgi:hypothetical protein